MRPIRQLGLWVLIMGLSGCATGQMVARMASSLVEGQTRAIYEESDLELAERALPAGLKMMEGMAHQDPGNRTLLLTLAEGFCNYAFGFVEDTDPERAAGLYLRGRDYAVRALAQAGGPEDLTALGLEDFRKTVASLKAPQMPALYWTGRCWAGWLMLSLDDLEALAAISKLEIAMNRVLAWDETFDEAGPHLFFGSFYGGRSRMLGGNPDKARKHFERALELTGKKFLIPYLLYARLVAVQTQDKALFERLLQTLLEAPPDALPSRRLANEIARRKARRLLEDANDYF